MAYAPSPNTTTAAGQAHLASVYYRRKGLDRLETKFVFREYCMKDSLPKQNGRTMQWYRLNNLTAVTTPTTEGTIGTSGTYSSRTVAANVSQYSSFLSISDLLDDTSISAEVVNMSELLGYQAGLSVDTMTRNVIDAENIGCTQSLLGTSFAVQDLRNARSQLAANNVQPIRGEFFGAVIHPFISFDLVNDPNANGLADIFKYNTNVQATPLVTYQDRGQLSKIAGCDIQESTNVAVNTGVTPNQYRTYVFGLNGIAAVDLEGRGPSDVKDPKKEKFAIKVIKTSANASDPEGTIAAYVSYNFVFTTVVLEGPPTIGGQYRMRQIDAASTIA